MCLLCQSLGIESKALSVSGFYCLEEEPEARLVLKAVYSETNDASANITTPYIISVGDIFSGTLTYAGDQDWIAVTLDAGQHYRFELNGTGASPVSDTYLRLYDANGSQIANNDDGGLGLNSVLRYTTSATNTFYLGTESYADSYTGTYALSAITYAPIVFSNDQIAAQLTHGYWQSTGRDARSFNVAVGGTISVNITGLEAAAHTLARDALELWSDATGLNFSFTSGSAQIEFGDSDTYSAYSWSNVSGSDITYSYVNVGTGWLDYYGTSLVGYSFQTYIHEIGHALGLGHAGSYNGYATYGTDNHYANDSWQASIMSYFDQNENTYIDATRLYAVTPQVADIIAIRNLYGTTEATRTGDTRYGVNSNAGGVIQQLSNNPQLYTATIVDDGGMDLLDLSNNALNHIIDLREEAISSVLGGTGNLIISRGTVIESASTGSGWDTLIGNSADNNLSGGYGNDTLFGGAGSDTLAGGGGADALHGDNGFDWASYIGSVSAVNVDLSDGAGESGGHAEGDTLTSIENVFGSAFADTITGDDANNQLYGYNGNDTLRGGGGADTLNGGSGNDQLYGSDGNDQISGGAGTDWVYFSRGINNYTFSFLFNSIQIVGDYVDTLFQDIEWIGFADVTRSYYSIVVEFAPRIEVEANGEIDLSNFGEWYFVIDNGSQIVLTLEGKVLGPNTYDGWSIIHAEADGAGYKLLWSDGVGTYAGGTTDSNGVYVSSFAITNIRDHEVFFNADIDGDGNVGHVTSTIESSGSTNLLASDQYFVSNGGPQIALTLDGKALRPNTYDGWSIIHAEADGAGYKLLWSDGVGTYAGGTTDSNGVYVSSFAITNIRDHEVFFNADIDGDGNVGHVTSTIESSGSTNLLASDQYFVSNGGPQIALTLDGKALRPNTYDGWSIIHAEADGAGYKLLWSDGVGTYAGGTTDSNGVYVSSFAITNIRDHEVFFNADIDGDGNVGHGVVSERNSPIVTNGSLGADTFHFNEAGNYRITDFEDTMDLIEFDTNLVSSFDQLTFIENGDDVLVSHHHGSVLVGNLNLALLTADDFKFV